jgi:hypothetical protein
MARRIKAGSVRINGGGLDNNVPFGGYKQSGWGRENGREGVETFTEIKSVTIRFREILKALPRTRCGAAAALLKLCGRRYISRHIS